MPVIYCAFPIHWWNVTVMGFNDNLVFFLIENKYFYKYCSSSQLSDIIMYVNWYTASYGLCWSLVQSILTAQTLPYCRVYDKAADKSSVPVIA